MSEDPGDPQVETHCCRVSKNSGLEITCKLDVVPWLMACSQKEHRSWPCSLLPSPMCPLSWFHLPSSESHPWLGLTR